MNARTFKIIACMTWAGAAISNAAPTTAAAATNQAGPYAACSASYDYGTLGANFCQYGWRTFSYNQQIKLVSASCSSGGCASASAVTYTEFVYVAGRKVAYLRDVTCDPYVYGSLYDLGGCDC
jgi:hypothetical protein